MELSREQLRQIGLVEARVQVDLGARTSWQAAAPGEGLRQVLLIHRHGDRTPDVFPARDPLAQEPFWRFHGLGQLTNAGKARAHLLGRMMRERYGAQLLGRSANKNLTFSRSSGYARCVESAQCFLAAFLAPQTGDDAEQLAWGPAGALAASWQPASVAVVPVRMDGMLAVSSNRGNRRAVLEMLKASGLMQRLNVQQFGPERQLLEDKLGASLELPHEWAFAMQSLRIERSYFAHKMDGQVLAAMGRVEEAALIALNRVLELDKVRRSFVGLLLSELLAQMRARVDELTGGRSRAKRFLHYSTHDVQIAALLYLLTGRIDRHPDFCASLALELHQEGGERWCVRVFYWHSVPSEPRELLHCSLDHFAAMVERDRLTSWLQWMQESLDSPDKLEPYELLDLHTL